MNQSEIIKWGFRGIGIITLAGLFIINIVYGQGVRPKIQPKPKVETITDDNFKKKVSKGFVLVKFTAPYQMAAVDKKLFEGIKGFEGCVIYEVDHSLVKKVVKKLRIRNYPSIALFYNG